MKNILFLCFFCWQFSLVAQENIHLQFDKDFYVLGETMWCAAYLVPDNPNAQKAAMLRIELVDKEGNIRQANNWQIENGKTKGTMLIPLDWEEGWYTFHAYTVWNPNPTIKNSATVNIPIYDDFKPHQEGEIAGGNKEDTNFKHSLVGRVITDKSSYKRRELVTVDFELPVATMKSGSISVAVGAKAIRDATKDLQIQQSSFSTTANQKPEVLNTFYGQMKSLANGKKPLGIGMHYLADNSLQWTSADENGVFSTVNRLTMNQATQVFGLFNNQNNTYTTMLPSQVLNLTQTLSDAARITEQLPFNEAIKNYLLKSQQRKKYQEIFGLEQAVLAKKESVEKQHFKPDVVYNLADYASMTTLEEFLVEVVPFVKIKTKKGKPTIRMFNELKEFTNENPVYLINDWLTYDQDAVLEMPISEIESISIFRATNTLKSQFGILGNEGVIGIKTNTKNALKIKESLTNILPAKGVTEATGFSTLKASFNRLPDFRPLIYWNAEVEILDGKAQISFPHSDDLGDFMITIKGMTDDGQLIEGSGRYEVR